MIVRRGGRAPPKGICTINERARKATVYQQITMSNEQD